MKIDIAIPQVAARVEEHMRFQERALGGKGQLRRMASEDRIEKRIAVLDVLQKTALEHGVIFVRGPSFFRPEFVERRVRESLEKVAAEKLISMRKTLRHDEVMECVERRLNDGTAAAFVDAYLKALAVQKIGAIRESVVASAA